jgi:capsular polysaccharide transport system permease protein
LAIIYFGLIASDVYISESRFVVRSPERQSTSPLGAFFKGSGFARAQDDSFSVQDYILSRDALALLNEHFEVQKNFSSSDIDIFNRFAGLDRWNNSFEELHHYYQRKIVSVDLNSASSITTLTVRAFSSNEATQINNFLLERSEALVNQLNERGWRDMIHFAASEVAQAENKAKEAALALSDYRNRKGVINPEQQSSIQLQQVAKLQDELIATQAQLSHLHTFTKDNPQIPSLQQRVHNLRKEIQIETDRVAGGDRSLANKAAEFQRFALEREFADKQLASALASLEQARNEAQRKQLYLERIVQPSKPDAAMEPRRIRGVLTILVLGLIAWGVLTLLIAGIKEHQD